MSFRANEQREGERNPFHNKLSQNIFECCNFGIIKKKMPTAEEEFEALVDKQTDRAEIKKSHMFGFPSMTIHRKNFALLYQDSVVFKLTGDAHTQALSLEGAALWNPYGHRKKEWVQIPRQHAATWEFYANAASKYVSSLIKKRD